MRLAIPDAKICTLPAAVECANMKLSTELAYLTLQSQVEADLELAPASGWIHCKSMQAKGAMRIMQDPAVSTRSNRANQQAHQEHGRWRLGVP
ncbi:hypothetical protein MTO96_049057 [Rhipicephalus appendiculatus]